MKSVKKVYTVLILFTIRRLSLDLYDYSLLNT